MFVLKYKKDTSYFAIYEHFIEPILFKIVPGVLKLINYKNNMYISCQPHTSGQCEIGVSVLNFMVALGYIFY